VFLLGCFDHRNGRPDLQGNGLELRVLHVWQAPPSPPARYREDGEGPFPPSWPALAVVTQDAEQAERGGGIVSNATLFLVSGPGLKSTASIGNLLSHTRFATHCHVGDDDSCAGAWVLFGDTDETRFVLVDWAGGTIGLAVRVFDQRVGYLGDYQSHIFDVALYDGSRLPVYLGDADGDGRTELLIASEVSNNSGATGTPRLWRVMKWVGAGMVEIGEVGQAFIDAHPDLEPLMPPEALGRAGPFGRPVAPVLTGATQASEG